MIKIIQWANNSQTDISDFREFKLDYSKTGHYIDGIETPIYKAILIINKPNKAIPGTCLPRVGFYFLTEEERTEFLNSFNEFWQDNKLTIFHWSK